MIKVETLGMIDVAKNNPILTSDTDVANYSFLTFDDDLYLISNTVSGDDVYKEDVTISAGEYLNGFLVKAWDGQKLVVDDKHITYGNGTADYSAIEEGTTVLTAATDGTLEVASAAPTSGIYFKVTDKCTLTEKAVKVKVCVATASE